MKMHLDVAFLPGQCLLGPGVCIVIDVLRATSALVKMFDKGAEFVIPVETVEEAYQVANKYRPPLLLAGERGGLPIPGFDLNTCLIEIEKADLKGARIVLTTTNGTKALKSVESASLVITGSLLNARSCAEYAFLEAQEMRGEIVLVCSGHGGYFALCDAVCAGYIIKEIPSFKDLELSDSALAALALADYYRDPFLAFKESWSGKLLSNLGHEDDLRYCSQMNISSSVIVLQNQILKRAK
jgi:2-phosphosulfolactate phosphatase